MSNKPKIIHLIDDLNVGGLERTVEIICNGLKNNYDFSVWTLLGKGKIYDKLKQAGITTYCMAYPVEGSRIPLIIKLAGKLKRTPFDILHTHGYSANAIGVFASLLRNPCKIVYHVQNIYYDLSIKNRIKEKFTARISSRIIACSEAVKTCMVDYIGINSNNIQVIYNSSSLQNAEFDDPGKIRQEYDISPDDFVISSVGRLAPVKGHIYLINAMKQVISKHPETKLFIIGDGALKEDLIKSILENGLSKHIILPGLREDIGDILSASDLYVQPSIIREGLPLAIVEAMSRKLPVIATDIGGNDEAVINDFNGFIIPDIKSETIADKIIFLIKNKDKAFEMGKKGYELFLKKFTPEGLCSRVNSIYENLLK